MSDILERAEALCGDTYRYEETTEDTDGTLRNLVDRANILPELIAECKAQQERAASYSIELTAAGEIAAKREQALEDRITQLQQDNHRLHEHELLLDGEVKRLEAEAQDYHDQKEAALSQLVGERQELQAEAAQWQAVATEERCKVIMLIEKLKDVANHADWQTRGLSKTYDEYIKQAAEELQAAAALGCKPRAWLMTG